MLFKIFKQFLTSIWQNIEIFPHDKKLKFLKNILIDIQQCNMLAIISVAAFIFRGVVGASFGIKNNIFFLSAAV
jgi:hypothetical protein